MGLPGHSESLKEASQDHLASGLKIPRSSWGHDDYDDDGDDDDDDIQVLTWSAFLCLPNSVINWLQAYANTCAAISAESPYSLKEKVRFC